MILTYVVIAICIYAFFSAVSKQTATIESWSQSIFRKQKVSGFFGANEVTGHLKGVLGVRDIHTLAPVLQLLGIVCCIFMIIKTQYGAVLALPVIALGYSSYLISSFMISRYVVSVRKALWIRAAMMLGITIFFIVGVSGLNKEAVKYFSDKGAVIEDIETDPRLAEYSRLKDSFRVENIRLQIALDSLHTKQLSIIHTVDSISNVRFKDTKQTKQAIEFLKDFVISK